MCTALTYNWEFLHLCTFAACACLPAACASQPAYCVCTCLPAACACASQPANCACQPGACACTCQPAACDKLQFSNGWKWRHCRWQFAPALHQKRQSPKIRKYQQRNTKYIIKKIQNSACSCTELKRQKCTKPNMGSELPAFKSQPEQFCIVIIGRKQQITFVKTPTSPHLKFWYALFPTTSLWVSVYVLVLGY